MVMGEGGIQWLFTSATDVIMQKNKEVHLLCVSKHLSFRQVSYKKKLISSIWLTLKLFLLYGDRIRDVTELSISDASPS